MVTTNRSADPATMSRPNVTPGTTGPIGPVVQGPVVRGSDPIFMADEPLTLAGGRPAVLPGVSVAQLQDEIQTRAQAIARDIVAQQSLQTTIAASGRIFTRFDVGTDVINNQKTLVTTGLFSGNAATLSVMFTGSLQTTSSKQYYYEVYNGNSATSEAQFSIAFGHRLGSGSSAGGTLNDSPSRAVYSQYKLLLLNPGDPAFTFASGDSADEIYAINFNRARIKDKLDPGNWQLSLCELTGSRYANNVFTGSNVVPSGSNRVISLIDDSGQSQQTNLTSAGRVYNVVSGSIGGGVFNASAPKYYGLVYPDMGIVILNGNALDASMSFNTVSGSNIAGDNAFKLYTSISGAMSINSSANAFQARNEEAITSTHYFVRVKNGEYNFSNNPSFVTGSVGEFVQPTFITDPKTYITTIGMYNDRQELLAVAKLSQPVQKSFSNEALIKVKLDF
jgi:hypothetical protein